MTLVDPDVLNGTPAMISTHSMAWPLSVVSRQVVAENHPFRFTDHLFEVVDVARVDGVDAPLQPEPAGNLHARGHGQRRNLSALACDAPRSRSR